jgi:hypothetical protein
MHKAIGHCRIDPASVDEANRHIQEGLIPLIKDTSGFLALYALEVGKERRATR